MRIVLKINLLFAYLLLIVVVLGCRSSSKLLYPIEVESFYGYINRQGSLRIPPKYPYVERYSEGLAPVQRSDGSLVYLNLDGKELEVPTNHGQDCPINKLDVFSDGMARVVVGQKVGYIDIKLNWAILPQFRRAGQFSEGLAAVLDFAKRRAAYINKKGKEVFTLENVTAVGPMKAGFAYFVRNERFGIVNKEGKILRKPNYLFLASADPNTGLARAQDDESELFGFVNRNGNWIILPRYPNAKDFSGGFAAVFIRNKNAYGYIDSRGNMRISGQYLAAGGFQDGFAWVKTDKGFRYINSDGQWLSPLIFTYTHDFYEGLAAASQGESQLYINTQGGITWPSQ